MKTPRILVVDDNPDVILSIRLLFKQHGMRVSAAESPSDALAAIRANRPDLVIQDMNFQRDTLSGAEGIELLQQIRKEEPDLPVILITAWGNIDLAVTGMKQGAADFIIKPWQNAVLVQRVRDILQLSTDLPQLSRTDIDSRYRMVDIIGQDPQFLRQLAVAGKVAKTDASVLIRGENGSGKDVLATAIHRLSTRASKSFVKVNIGGVSTSLFDSEMFGHEKGAFTSAANQRIGRFEEANQGTIFLDEIGDLALDSQVKLLRVLQDRQLERMGSNQTIYVDVRVITATNQPLEVLMQDGQFREDLYYRLNTIEIKIPALRERRDDIPLLANHFLKQFNRKYQQSYELSADQLRALQAHAWPGNIRELAHVIERSILMSTDTLELMLNEAIAGAMSTDDTLENVERQMIVDALAQHANNITQAANQLGISRNALYRRMEKFGISTE